MSNSEKGRREVGGLKVDTAFFDFVEKALLPAIDVEPAGFWPGFEALIDELSPVNRELLQTRDELQQKIDEAKHFLDAGEMLADMVGAAWARPELDAFRAQLDIAVDKEIVKLENVTGDLDAVTGGGNDATDHWPLLAVDRFANQTRALQEGEGQRNLLFER